MNKFDIAGHRKIWFLLSLCVIIPGIILLATRGLNFGIDFTGGSIIDLQFEQPVTIQQVRDSLTKYDLGGSTIQLEGASGTATDASSSQNVMVRTVALEEDQRMEIMDTLKADCGDFQVLRQEKVGATIGGELITNAVLALVVSWALIILYVAYRFEWRFGVAAVLALVHDILVVLAVFAFTQRQVDSSFIAALLTIVGYSINDTIVIFDRIRENMRLHFRRGGDINQLVNTSVYQTLTRSLYTVFTVLFTTAALDEGFRLCPAHRFRQRRLFLHLHRQPDLDHAAQAQRRPAQGSGQGCRGISTIPGIKIFSGFVTAWQSLFDAFFLWITLLINMWISCEQNVNKSFR